MHSFSGADSGPGPSIGCELLTLDGNYTSSDPSINMTVQLNFVESGFFSNSNITGGFVFSSLSLCPTLLVSETPSLNPNFRGDTGNDKHSESVQGFIGLRV